MSKTSQDTETTRRRATPRDARAERVRDARVAPDRASAAHPAEPRREASAQKTIDVPGMVSSAESFASRYKVPLIVIGGLLLIVLALYGPAKSYYIAWRTGQGLQSQLEALNTSNEEYNDDITALQTREGIEDEARKRGYVSEGETKVVVDGLTEEDDAVVEEVVEEKPWYIQLGDTFFHYTGN